MRLKNIIDKIFLPHKLDHTEMKPPKDKSIKSFKSMVNLSNQNDSENTASILKSSNGVNSSLHIRNAISSQEFSTNYAEGTVSAPEEKSKATLRKKTSDTTEYKKSNKTRPMSVQFVSSPEINNGTPPKKVSEGSYFLRLPTSKDSKGGMRRQPSSELSSSSAAGTPLTPLNEGVPAAFSQSTQSIDRTPSRLSNDSDVTSKGIKLK